ncbi:MAG: hypothetical protein V3U43_00980, partial [Pseudomonadales bacterium]
MNIRWTAPATPWWMASLTFLLLGCGESAPPAERGVPSDDMVVFDNGTWRVSTLADAMGSSDFELILDGAALGRSTRINIEHVDGAACRLEMNGLLRCKVGASLPFGQGLTLGPTLTGSSASFAGDALFGTPQLTRIAVDTSGLDPSGTGTLLWAVEADALAGALPMAERLTNHVMSLTWTLTMSPPGNSQLEVSIVGDFSFVETLTLEPSAVDAAEAFRVVNLRSMFLDELTHDVDQAVFNRDGDSPLVLDLEDAPMEELLPDSPIALATSLGEIQLRHVDDIGEPNGDTPSVSIRNLVVTGDIFDADAFARLRITPSSDPAVDNVELFVAHAMSRSTFDGGDSAGIAFDVVISSNPITFADGAVIGPSFSADIQPIFVNNCALSGCHAPPAPQRGLDLSEGNAYAEIVNIDAEQVVLKRIAPGTPDDSYLIRKLEG